MAAEKLSAVGLTRALGGGRLARTGAWVFEKWGEGFRLYPMAFQLGWMVVE